jgi:hypothetical protein
VVSPKYRARRLEKQQEKLRRKAEEHADRDRRYAQGYKQIEKFENAHRRERCFIVAGGPSLTQLDLGLLGNDIVFSMNRVYRGFDWGLPKIDYYVLVDRPTYKTIHNEARALDLGIRFYRSAVLDMPEYKDATNPEPAIPLNFTPTDAGHHVDFRFATNPLEGIGIHRNGTVVLPIVQIAYYMGFQEVYIIGCDLEYSRKKKFHFYTSNDEISRKEKSRRGEMDVEAVLSAFTVCRNTYEASGRKLINASPGGNLDVLPRVKFSDLFAAKNSKPRFA